jgi:prepilin-type N-terminal cleavage/methylation domain-containing protein
VSRRREEGFTLIELAVALGVFAIAIVSLTLLFDQAVESANRARFDELGKTLAQRELEEIRSFPFHISQKEEVGDVDLLDLYFPGTTNGPTPTGAAGTYDGTANVWTYTSAETITSEARPYTRTVAVQFVAPQDDGSVQPRAPLAGYDSNVADLDLPATDAVQVTVTVSRTVNGQPRSVALDTVVARVEQESPSVQASGSVLGGQVSGVTFNDGDVGGVAAEVLAEVGKIQVAFREITESTSQATADPVQVVERDPGTGTTIQPEAPTSGQATASVPNSSTGTTQSTSASISSGSLGSVNGSGAIAAWGSTSPSATAEARVSALHTLNPEGRATVATEEFRLNARRQGDAVPLLMVLMGDVTGEVEQGSTTSQATVEAVVDILPEEDDESAITVRATRQFDSHPDFEGVVTIDGLHVDAEVTAGTTAATTVVNWSVEDLRVWDPLKPNGLGPLGGYGASYTFGFRSDCGGWVADPALCGALRTDGKLPFENPNPVLIPASYVGVDALGNAETSLSIVAGVTVQDSSVDAAAGISSASVAQKNVLNITTRDDLAGAVPLEQMLLGVGDANVSVSYISHVH